jgi:hypothetical protein
MSRCDDWAEGWEEGRQQGEADMLAKCIAALEDDSFHDPDPSWSGTHWNNAVFECKEALRALQEVDTPQQEINEHINFDTANRIGDDTTLQNAGREPYKSPNGYDPRATENRP